MVINSQNFFLPLDYSNFLKLKCLPTMTGNHSIKSMEMAHISSLWSVLKHFCPVCQHSDECWQGYCPDENTDFNKIRTPSKVISCFVFFFSFLLRHPLHSLTPFEVILIILRSLKLHLIILCSHACA